MKLTATITKCDDRRCLVLALERLESDIAYSFYSEPYDSIHGQVETADGAIVRYTLEK